MHPDSKVHGANMGPIWGRHYPGGTYVGPMDFAIWATMKIISKWPISRKIPPLFRNDIDALTYTHITYSWLILTNASTGYMDVKSTEYLTHKQHSLNWKIRYADFGSLFISLCVEHKYLI